MKYMCLEMCVFIFVIAVVSGCGKVETKDAKKEPTAKYIMNISHIQKIVK